jgi:hypothetical protein
MKTYLDCYPCLLGQALKVARLSGADETQQQVVVNRALDTLKEVSPSSTPPEMGALTSCQRDRKKRGLLSPLYVCYNRGKHSPLQVRGGLLCKTILPQAP